MGFQRAVKIFADFLECDTSLSLKRKKATDVQQTIEGAIQVEPIKELPIPTYQEEMVYAANLYQGILMNPWIQEAPTTVSTMTLLPTCASVDSTVT